MTEAFCAPETGAAGYSACRSTHEGCSNLNWPLSSSEAEEQKQRCLKPLLYSLPEAAPLEARHKITADCKRARNKAGQNKVSSPNSVFYPDTNNPKIAPCCNCMLCHLREERNVSASGHVYPGSSTDPCHFISTALLWNYALESRSNQPLLAHRTDQNLSFDLGIIPDVAIRLEAFSNQKKWVKQVTSKELCCVIQIMNLSQEQSTDSRLCLRDYIGSQRNCSSLTIHLLNGESWEWGKREREGSERNLESNSVFIPQHGEHTEAGAGSWKSLS